MSALSLIGQAQIIPYAFLAGAGNDGVQDEIFNEVIPAGFYIGQTVITLNGAGVTSGAVAVDIGVQGLAEAFIGEVGVSSTSSVCFFFDSNGTSALTIDVVGFGANWTSVAGTLFLRRLV